MSLFSFPQVLTSVPPPLSPHRPLIAAAQHWPASVTSWIPWMFRSRANENINGMRGAITQVRSAKDSHLLGFHVIRLHVSLQSSPLTSLMCSPSLRVGPSSIWNCLDTVPQSCAHIVCFSHKQRLQSPLTSLQHYTPPPPPPPPPFPPFSTLPSQHTSSRLSLIHTASSALSLFPQPNLWCCSHSWLQQHVFGPVWWWWAGGDQYSKALREGRLEWTHNQERWRNSQKDNWTATSDTELLLFSGPWTNRSCAYNLWREKNGAGSKNCFCHKR